MFGSGVKTGEDGKVTIRQKLLAKRNNQNVSSFDSCGQMGKSAVPHIR
jgi:hypothetical protein